MTKKVELWQFIAAHLRRDERVLLLIVGESSGSSPGRQGFKMAVTVDEMCGSIGGGVMEVNLVNEARRILSVPPAVAGGLTEPSQEITVNGTTFVSAQTHQKNAANASGLICSGKQTVVFKLLTVENVSAVELIIDSIKNRKQDDLIIGPDKFAVEPTDPDAPSFRFESSSEIDFLYRERIGAKNELDIVGGGHCALALSELISKMDFYIRIFDDRPDLNTIEKNSFADEKLIIESYEQIGDQIAGGANVFVVVVTVGFASDEIVIRQLLDKTFRYFGVLGSKAKMATLLKNLNAEGFPEEKLRDIRTPIGLPINSQTPEEIAISIAAEIISVKNS